MKLFRIAVAAGIAAASSSAVAQMNTPNSYAFVDAVKSRDGDKATQLVTDHPTVVNSRDGAGNTALLIAINRNDPTWTGFLLNKGADPNLAGVDGDTPLIAAARIGFEDAAEWLIGLGAKVDATNKMGETPLIVAVQQRNTHLVRVLLEHGANPDRSDAAAGYSARDYAKRDPRARDILALIQSAKPAAAK
jgi:ankyrin repeat protein